MTNFKQLVVFVGILLALNFFLDLHISIIGSLVLSIVISFVMNRTRWAPSSNDLCPSNYWKNCFAYLAWRDRAILSYYLKNFVTQGSANDKLLEASITHTSSCVVSQEVRVAVHPFAPVITSFPALFIGLPVHRERRVPSSRNLLHSSKLLGSIETSLTEYFILSCLSFRQAKWITCSSRLMLSITKPAASAARLPDQQTSQ